jgi:hypothetical protein
MAFAETTTRFIGPVPIMDCNNTIPVNIYYENTSLERLLEESEQDFPVAGIAINSEREHSAETQAGSAHEIVRIVLDPELLGPLLGIAKAGFAGGVARETGGKLGEQITEDLYGWIKRFLKRLVEDFRSDFTHARYQKGILGPRLDITSSNDAELKCVFHIVYSGDHKRFSFDRLSACLDIFQLIIRPIIGALSETAKVRTVIIHGRLSFDSAATWVFKVETADHLYSFPEISLEGVIDSDTARKIVSNWTKRSNEIKKTSLRTRENPTLAVM